MGCAADTVDENGLTWSALKRMQKAVLSAAALTFAF